MSDSKKYLAIDLKSYYASVECVDRGLDPLTTNLVVADVTRTEKTICLAASPSIKSYGIGSRDRLFNVVSKVKRINAERRRKSPNGQLIEGEVQNPKILENPELALNYLVAPPRMARYIEVSSIIYDVYLKYFSRDDIYVYSIDEVFIDITNYGYVYHLTPNELARKVIKDVLATTGITATAGIGTNMYLAKIAMDIDAKKMEPDENGVRVSELDEISYRARLWDHEPITDFWRIGPGIARRLANIGIFTQGDIARCSIGGPGDQWNEDLLYEIFGINAELIIDHAWGWEPVTMAEVKSYQPVSNSLGTGQVLHHPYTHDKARIAIREMAELLVLDMVKKEISTNQLVITIGYDIKNLLENIRRQQYTGKISEDRYGRKTPMHSHGTQNIGEYTSSTEVIIENVLVLYDRLVNKDLLIRRLNITANNIIATSKKPKQKHYYQLNLLTDYDELMANTKEREARLEREKRQQKAILDIQSMYGKNALLKGLNLKEGATTIERNQQIGGHHA